MLLDFDQYRCQQIYKNESADYKNEQNSIMFQENQDNNINIISSMSDNKNQQKINQSKQIPTMQNLQETSGKEFVLAKFEPGNILLINRYSKKPYNYFEVKNSRPQFQQLKHEALLRPLFYGNGLLYEKGESNMQVQFENRRRGHQKDYFAEQELLNTFEPIFQCVQFLHNKNIIHGQIHPQNILFVQGQIKLRDWLVEIQNNAYYSKQKKEQREKFHDLQALGFILAQFATLKRVNCTLCEKDIPMIIDPIIDNYSKNLIFILLTVLKSKNQLFSSILPLIQNKSTLILDNQQLNTIYAKIKSNKMQKTLKLMPQEKVSNIMPTPKKSDNALIQSSPSKKFNITQTTKKSNRGEDIQNKKVFNEEVKKRQIQKITKIIERSNAFVNQLMARKNNSQTGALKNNSEHNGVKFFGQVGNQQQVLKKISGKNNVNLGMTMNNLSMHAVESAKKAKEVGSGITFSPSKRMRTISRKK